MRQHYILGKALNKKYKEFLTQDYNLSTYSNISDRFKKSFLSNSYSLFTDKDKSINKKINEELLLPSFKSIKNVDNLSYDNIFNKNNIFYPVSYEEDEEMLNLDFKYCPDHFLDYIKIKTILKLKELDDKNFFDSLYANIVKSRIFKDTYNGKIKTVGLDNIFDITDSLMTQFYVDNYEEELDLHNQISFFLNILINKFVIIYSKINKFKEIGISIKNILLSENKELSIYSNNDEMIIQFLYRFSYGNYDNLIKYYNLIYNSKVVDFNNYYKYKNEKKFIPFTIFSSALIFEIYKENDKKFVKMSFNGEYYNFEKNKEILEEKEFLKILDDKLIFEKADFVCKPLPKNYINIKIILAVIFLILFSLTGFLIGYKLTNKNNNKITDDNYFIID